MDSGKLSKRERQDFILAEMKLSPVIRVSRLAKRIGVTGETIRRDLIELGEAGLIERTYGGATIPLVASEPALSEREQALIEERARIGRGATELVQGSRILMIDAGSTTAEVARSLAQRGRDLVVITNSTALASILAANQLVRVILCPGTYDHREGGVFGEETIGFIHRYHADVCIVGATGVSADGPNDVLTGAVAVKSAMMRQSSSSILVVTHEKFGRASLQRICGFDEVSEIVTDAEPPEEIRALIERAGTGLHVMAAG